MKKSVAFNEFLIGILLLGMQTTRLWSGKACLDDQLTQQVQLVSPISPNITPMSPNIKPTSNCVIRGEPGARTA